MNRTRTLLLCLGILLAGGVVVTIIFSTEPTAQRTGATKTTAMLVDVLPVERGTHRPTIEAMGTVRPVQEVVLSPRVSGQVVRRADAFVPGGTVAEGETLLQIDPADYETALRQRESELRQAESDLKVARWEHELAEREYRLRDDTLAMMAEANRSVALREPQLDAAQSAVASARAAVEQARLNLQRTTVTAPFDAHIVRRTVAVGSQVAPGEELARLVGVDRYWVEATVPLSKLRWLSVPEGESADEASGTGAPVRIRNRTAWEDGRHREGRLARVVGALEDDTRMARVLVEVPDPHAHRPEHDGRPRLMIGSYVETQIQADTLAGVVRLDRDYVRDDGTVWVMEDGALQIRDVQIALRDAQHAYVRHGLADGDSVVTTNLTTVRNGAPLRLNGSDSGTTSGDDGEMPEPGG